MRILIVDDSKAMRMIVTRTVRQAGFGGHDFEEAAKRKINKHAYDYVAGGSAEELTLKANRDDERQGGQNPARNDDHEPKARWPASTIKTA